MALFSANDRAIVEGLQYDPAARAGYEMIKGILAWTDERPVGITPDGYDKLCDLWVARSYLHRGLEMPERLRAVWEEALRDELQWIGFRRLTPTREEHDYYEACLRDGE